MPDRPLTDLELIVSVAERVEEQQALINRLIKALGDATISIRNHRKRIESLEQAGNGDEYRMADGIDHG